MLKRIFNSDSIFGAVILAVSIWFYTMASRFSQQTADGQVNEGFFPKLIAVCVALMAVGIIINGIRKNARYFEMTPHQREGFKPLVMMLGLFALYILAWPYVHFIIQTAVFCVAMCLVLKMSKLFTVCFSLVFSVGLYYLFAYGFSILL